MKYSEFTKWLKSKGVTFKQGKKHIRLSLNGKQSTLPRHAGEINDGLRNAIIKQPNLTYP
jgi:mRNA interferase HicA